MDPQICRINLKYWPMSLQIVGSLSVADRHASGEMITTQSFPPWLWHYRKMAAVCVYGLLPTTLTNISLCIHLVKQPAVTLSCCESLNCNPGEMWFWRHRLSQKLPQKQSWECCQVLVCPSVEIQKRAGPECLWSERGAKIRRVSSSCFTPLSHIHFNAVMKVHRLCIWEVNKGRIRILCSNEHRALTGVTAGVIPSQDGLFYLFAGFFFSSCVSFIFCKPTTLSWH